MKRIEVSSEVFAAIVGDIDERIETLRQAALEAMVNEEIAERRFAMAETAENWDKLKTATAKTKSLEQTVESLEKLAEGMYSVSIALADLSGSAENELKFLGLI